MQSSFCQTIRMRNVAESRKLLLLKIMYIFKASLLNTGNKIKALLHVMRFIKKLLASGIQCYSLSIYVWLLYFFL
jgi:hypothetical protein